MLYDVVHWRWVGGWRCCASSSSLRLGCIMSCVFTVFAVGWHIGDGLVVTVRLRIMWSCICHSLFAEPSVISSDFSMRQGGLGIRTFFFPVLIPLRVCNSDRFSSWTCAICFGISMSPCSCCSGDLLALLLHMSMLFVYIAYMDVSRAISGRGF